MWKPGSSFLEYRDMHRRKGSPQYRQPQPLRSAERIGTRSAPLEKAPKASTQISAASSDALPLSFVPPDGYKRTTMKAPPPPAPLHAHPSTTANRAGPPSARRLPRRPRSLHTRLHSRRPRPQTKGHKRPARQPPDNPTRGTPPASGPLVTRVVEELLCVPGNACPVADTGANHRVPRLDPGLQTHQSGKADGCEFGAAVVGGVACVD
jgi:hypothetical protein